jgi:hypothetical protein
MRVGYFGLLVLITFAHADAYSCPDFDAIAQPGVHPSKWRQEDMNGVWYIVATNEPTIPTNMMRQCGVLNWTVYTDEYRYTNTVTQTGLWHRRHNITVMNAGYRSKDPRRPGNCTEGFGIFNRTVDVTTGPNMFFNYSAIEGFYMSYACVGKTMFSYILAARSPLPSVEWIREKMSWASALGMLDLQNIVISDAHTRRTLCWGENDVAVVV